MPRLELRCLFALELKKIILVVVVAVAAMAAVRTGAAAAVAAAAAVMAAAAAATAAAVTAVPAMVAVAQATHTSLHTLTLPSPQRAGIGHCASPLETVLPLPTTTPPQPISPDLLAVAAVWVAAVGVAVLLVAAVGVVPVASAAVVVAAVLVVIAGTWLSALLTAAAAAGGAAAVLAAAAATQAASVPAGARARMVAETWAMGQATVRTLSRGWGVVVAAAWQRWWQHGSSGGSMEAMAAA